MKKICLALFALLLCTVAHGADRDLLTPEPHRITDEAIAADLTAMQGLQERLAGLNRKGVPIVSYHFAKAQAWLDFAMDEYTVNDRSRVVEEALGQALGLIVQLERGTKDIALATPIIPTSAVIRPDLWDRAEALKKDANFLRCAGDKIAQLEVQLVWAGHENRQLGWRHAKPYLQAAERLAREADAQAAACTNQEAFLSKPAPPPLAAPSSADMSLASAAGSTAAKPAEPATVVVPAPAGAVKAPEPPVAAAADQTAPAGALPPLPAVAALSSNCPEISAAVPKVLSPLPDRVHFALNRAEIGVASAALLDRIATAMKSEPALRVILQGHADQRGDFTYNIGLSQRRANSVRSYLVNAGVAGERISVIALGKAKPLITAGTIDGYARNRRVEFVFSSCESPLLINQREDLQPE